MSTIQPTTTITVDGAVFEVAGMSQEVQNMVTYYDKWRQEEFEATSRLLMVRGALKDIQNEILATIQRDRQAEADAANAAANDATTDTPV